MPTESYSALPEEGERLRTITRLQQRAAALENEVIQHQESRSRNHELMAEVRKRELVEDRLRTLTGRLLSIRDEERRRVARELHESTAQRLTALSMNMCLLQEVGKGRSAETNEIVTQCNDLVKGLLDEVRTLSHMLHPPLLEEVGLQSALRWYVHRFAERSKIKVALELPANLGRLSRETEIAVFRIVQEALANVHRHSGSSTASITLRRDEQRLSLIVEDAGSGIAPEKQAELASGLAGNFGIHGMRERLRPLGGTLEVKSGGAGTLLLVVLPITAQSSALSSPESNLVD
jgi:signal transduction histidine kinase